MQIRKVTKEFRQLEVNRLAREARQYARKVSAYGTFQHVSYDVDDDAGDNCDEEEFLDKSYNEQKDQTSIVETRSQSSRKLLPVTMSDKSIQVTDLTEQTSVRMLDNTRVVHSKYLQASSMLMAEGLSAAEAVKAIYIIDTIVWHQTRFLPLVLDKDYVNMQSKLKKLSVNIFQKEENNDTEVAAEVSELQEDVTEDAIVDVEGSDDARSKMVAYLTEEITKKKAVYEQNSMSVLPDLRTVQHNHHLLAVYVEKRIGEELAQHGGFCIPDGTTRNKVGEISAVVVKVNGKMRAMKAQRIGKGIVQHGLK